MSWGRCKFLLEVNESFWKFSTGSPGAVPLTLISETGASQKRKKKNADMIGSGAGSCLEFITRMDEAETEHVGTGPAVCSASFPGALLDCGARSRPTGWHQRACLLTSAALYTRTQGAWLRPGC